MKIYLAVPRGFCAGVTRAVGIVEAALRKFGAPVYVRHEVVHNRFVVDGLRERGAVFIEDLSEVPDGSVLIFSAHGVPESVRQEAKSRPLRVFDATCPLVTRVHAEVRACSRKGESVIMIGHAGHPEVEGTLGQYSSEKGVIRLVGSVADAESVEIPDPEGLHFVTQTTLSVTETNGIIEVLRRRFPGIEGPYKDDICYATQNRQDAVRKIAAKVGVFLVVGSKNSSNSNRLRELATDMGCRAHLIDSAADLDESWFADGSDIGITAGASAPDIIVDGVVRRVAELTHGTVEVAGGVPETRSHFDLPRELQEQV